MSGWSNTDVNASKPKYLNANDRNNNNANVYGVSVLQASIANTANQKFKAAHQGWVKIVPEYTDSSGQVRRKSETLVVMGATITGNANVRISGTANVTNGNVSIAANVTATLVNGNTYAIFTANVVPLMSNGDVIVVGNNGPFSVNLFSSAGLNVALNTAATFSMGGQRVWFAQGTAKGNTSLSGLNLGTRFSNELKIGDVITVGNVGDAFQGIVRRVTAIANNGVLTMNAAAANVNTGLIVLVGDEQWFPHS